MYFKVNTKYYVISNTIQIIGNTTKMLLFDKRFIKSLNYFPIIYGFRGLRRLQSLYNKCLVLYYFFF